MSKVTPKTFECASEKGKCSCCRLCLKICDVTRVKELSRPANANIKKLAEDCLGDNLIWNQNLPQNICRTCERRLFNYGSFRNLIANSQVLSSHNSEQKDALIHRLVDCQRQIELNSTPFHVDDLRFSSDKNKVVCLLWFNRCTVVCKFLLECLFFVVVRFFSARRNMFDREYPSNHSDNVCLLLQYVGVVLIAIQFCVFL